MKPKAIILLVIALALTGCSDAVEPAAVIATVNSPADVYTEHDAVFSATCSSSDGLASARYSYSGPDEEFTQTEQPTGNTFTTTFTKRFSEPGAASLELHCESSQGATGSAQTVTTINAFLTTVSLEIRNAATGELSAGFVQAGSDSIASDTGRLELELTDPSITTIRTGLIGQGFGNYASYLRELSVQPGGSNSLVSYNVDFHFRSPSTHEILGSLATTGYDREGEMDLYRFLLHLEENILREGVVPRWDGFVPEKIVFADSIHFETTGNSYAFIPEEADLLFETYKRQQEDIIQPHLQKEVPFERVDRFVYTSDSSVDNIVVLLPSSAVIDRGNLADIILRRDGARNLGASISFRDVLPDKEINRHAYDAILNRTFLHEIYSALINVGRSGVHTRPEESILISSLALFNEISLVDGKVLSELSQNPHIGSSERASTYLILPPGYPVGH